MSVTAPPRRYALPLRLLLILAGLAGGLGAPPAARAAADPGLLLSEVAPSFAGSDESREYVELIATRDIDFAATPFSVVFASNGFRSDTTNGWVAGGALTYGFNITSGTISRGEVAYVGGSAMPPTGRKLRVIDTATTPGDRFGNPAAAGVLGGGGLDADGVAVFAADINDLTSGTVPVDALFFGSDIGDAAAPSGGYELPVNDRYSGGKLAAGSFLVPEPNDDSLLRASGSFNTTDGVFTAPRTWTSALAADDPASAVILTETLPGQVAPACGNEPLRTVASVPTSRPISASDSNGVVSSATIVSQPVPGISLGNFSAAPAAGGTATANLRVSGSVGLGTYNVTVRWANSDQPAQTAECTVQVQVLQATRIRTIQGAGHISPLVSTVNNNAISNGQAVNTLGIVTALRGNGFYMQDPEGDANPATSEGIFVFTGAAPTVGVGNAVGVIGTAAEFRGGCTSSSCTASSSAWSNLTTTQVSADEVVVAGTGVSLPSPVVIGQGGRVPPAAVIDDDTAGSVEVAAQTGFDPASDGIDFYESLEGMRVQVNNPVAVGPTVVFGGSSNVNRELPVLADNGAGAGTRTARGGIIIQPGDFNPERIFLSDNLRPGDANDPDLPVVDVADRFAGAVVGVLDYSFANYKLLLTANPPAPTDGELTKETQSLGAPAADELTVASFNLENLGGDDAQERFDAAAAAIAGGLGAPDIVALEEVQDDNGATNNGVVSAGVTLGKLVAAIERAGGPAYQFAQVDPANGQDGGEPGGNIRVAFLYRTDRGLIFPARGAASATTANSVEEAGGEPQLTLNPGRIDPANPAFADSRKPLAAEFQFNGRRVFVIANHFNSKGGDQPLFGRFQPPALASEEQREQQATAVAGFVDAIQAVDAQALIVVAGDLNDFEFSPPLTIPEAAGLNTLIESLPLAERYSYNFQGNAQALDHILVSDSAEAALAGYDIVHLNSEFADQTSDHDPQLARLTITPPPNRAPTLTSVSALEGATQGQPYTISYAALAAAANESDPDGDALVFRVEQVLSGTLTKGGDPAQPGVTTLGAGESLIFTPGAAGTLDAFRVVASDGIDVSAPAVTVRVVAAPAPNRAPTLTAISPLSGATKGQPYTISYAALAAAANEADPDGDALVFRVEQVLAGTLTKGGAAVQPGVTTLGPGQSLVYTPAQAGAEVAAFTVVASDGDAVSTPAVTVRLNVGAAPNRAPALTAISPLGGATKGQPYTISYAALAAAANESDPDGDALVFRVEQVLAGTLTKGGAAVQPGVTTLGPGQSLVYTPAQSGAQVAAFTVVASDGRAVSAPPVTVRVQVSPIRIYLPLLRR